MKKDLFKWLLIILFGVAIKKGLETSIGKVIIPIIIFGSILWVLIGAPGMDNLMNLSH